MKSEVGILLLDAASRTLQVGHPSDSSAGSIPLVMICEELGERHGRDVVVTGHVGSHPGGGPEVRGTAFITGMHQFLLDDADKFPEGFIF